MFFLLSPLLQNGKKPLNRSIDSDISDPIMLGQLKPAILHILSKGEKNGYAIIHELEQQTGWKPSPGSLYPLLKKLTQQRLVTVRRWPRKNIYSLTAKGKEMLHHYLERKDQLIGSMQERMQLYQTISGDNMKDILEILKRIKEGKAPIGFITEEMIALRGMAVEISGKKLSETDKKKIKSILRETNRKLRVFL